MTNFASTKCFITDNVFKRVNELLLKNNSAAEGLRISVEGGGCSGFQYKYELTNNITENDIVIERLGTKVIIDQISAPFIENSQIDYIEDLGSAHFEIKNPNATSKCGCGSSFSI